MEQVTINCCDAQVLERAGERLLDLDWDGSRGSVGQALVLSPPEGELGLQEQIVPYDETRLHRRCNTLPDCGLAIMASLVGGIDASKSLLQGELRQALRGVLLPGGAVQEARHAHTIDRQGLVEH